MSEPTLEILQTHLNNKISLIFKAIDSSVDGSNKTLALFNKNFDDYKTNWQNSIKDWSQYNEKWIGVSRGGLKDQLSSIFKSNDTNALKEYNRLIQDGDGIKPSEAFKATMMNCTTEAKKNAVAIAKGSMTYKQASTSLGNLTISAKASQIALKGLAIAGNMIAFWAITTTISAVVKGIDNLAHASEKCAERAEELKSSFNSALDSANSNAKTIEGLADKYEKLSKGVDNLGQNVSLTTDEYKEYNDIVNQISDMFPELITGYTSEGNAILSLKGNVDQLRDAYKEAQEEAYRMLIVSGKNADGNDILKNYQNIVNGDEFLDVRKSNGADYKLSSYRELENAILEQLATGKSSHDTKGSTAIGEWVAHKENLLKDLGITAKQLSNAGTEELNVLLKNIHANIKSVQSEIEIALKDTRDLAKGYLINDEFYKNIDNDEIKNSLLLLVDSIDTDLADTFGTDKINVGKYVNNVLSAVNDNSDVQEALINLLKLDLSELPINEAQNTIDQYIQTIAIALKEDPESLKIRLKFEDVETLAKNYETVMKKASQKFKGSNDFNTEYSQLDEFAKLNSINTQDEIAAWNQIIEESQTREEAMQKYLELEGSAQGLPSLEELAIRVNGDEEAKIAGITGEYALLKEILSNTGDVSQETYAKLLSCSAKYSTSLKTESGRLTINRQKLLAVAKSRSNETKQTIKQISAQKKLEYLEQAQKLSIYDNQLIDTTSDTYLNIEALQSEIAQYDLLAQGLDNATGAFERFREAQSTDNSDLYDTSTDAFNAVKDALESGQVGTDDMRTAMELLMSKGQYEEFLKLGNSAENPLEKQYLFMEKWAATNKQFFGEDMKKNAINFFNYLDKTGLLADGVLATSEEIGKKTGMSIESINSLVQLGNLYGFKDVIQQEPIDYLDNYTQKLSDLQSAKQAYEESSATDKDSNETLGLKFDYEEALRNYDNFISAIPEKYIEMQDKYTSSGTTDSFGDWLIGDMGEENTLGFLQSVNDKIDSISKEKMKLAEQNKDSGFYSSAQYKGLQQELELFQTIQSQFTNRDTTFLRDSDVQRFAQLKSLQSELQDSLKSAGNIVDINNIQDKIAEVKDELSNLSEPTIVDLQLNKTAIDAQITEVTSQIDRLKTSSANAGKRGSYMEQNAIQSAINTASSKKDSLVKESSDYEIAIKYVADTTEAETALDNIEGREIGDKTVPVSVDDQGVLGRLQTIDNFKFATKTIPISTPSLSFGGLSAGSNASSSTSGSGGTAHALGTAYANGSYEIPSNQDGYVGEVATESLSRDGKFYLIGQRGTERVSLKKGDIVFNHKQTAELIKNGYITSRGKAIGGDSHIKSSIPQRALGNAHALGTAIGTAHASGNVNNKWNTPYINSGADVIKQNQALKKASEDTAKDVEEKAEETKDEFENLFDWIEVKLSRLKRLTEKWLNQAETAISNSMAAKYWKKETKSIQSEISNTSKAYKRYLKEADSIGLDKSYIKKIKNGTIDLEKITDETLSEQVESYQNYYEKALNCADQLIELANKLYQVPLDKAATKIEKYSDAISLLDAKLNNAVGASAKNALVNQQTKQERYTLKANQTAVTESNKNLKSTSKTMRSSSTLKGLSSSLKKEIKKQVSKGGEINLSKLTEGTKAYEAAVKYNESLKANSQAVYDLQLAQEEYATWLREASKQKFDNVAQDYENAIRLLENQEKKYSNKVSEIESSGAKVGRAYYQMLERYNQQQKNQYTAEKKALEELIKTIPKGTEEWYEANDMIQSCSDAISDCVKNTYDLNNAINDLNRQVFQDISDQLSRIINEQDFLRDLFAHENLTDKDTGSLSEAGLAELGTYVSSYEIALAKAKQDEARLNELKKILASGKLGTFNSLEDLKAEIESVYDQWQNDIQETYALQSKIADLMKQKYEAQIDLMGELIDKKKEALQLEKDLYDYQNSISKKVKDITTIQKQMAAYSGNTSEEAKAKLQKLQVELNDKQKDLKETEYEKYLDDQEDMLDKMLEDFKELVQKKLEDFHSLVQEGLDTANSNLGSISDYLEKVAGNNGYTTEFKIFTSSIQSIIEAAIKNSSASQGKADSDAIFDTSGKGYQSATPKIVSLTTNDTTKGTSASSGSSSNTSTAESSKDERNKVKAYIKKYASKANAKKSKYTDFNQKIYEYTNGKVMSTAEIKTLAKQLGVSHNNLTSSGNMYKHLKSIKFPGFKRGGIIRKMNDTIRENGDTLYMGGFSARPGEMMMPEKFTDTMPWALETMDKLVNLAPKLDIPDYSKLFTQGNTNNTVGDVSFNIELNNVTNGDDIINELKRSPKLQRAFRAVTIDRLVGGSKFNINSIK